MAPELQRIIEAQQAKMKDMAEKYEVLNLIFRIQ